jgi:putative membrane-bound dehydrogenase-like protein
MVFKHVVCLHLTGEGAVSIDALSWWLAALVFACSPILAPAAPPVCVDDRLTIELVAREPEIVTPTGIAVDEAGRVWVIENNTHERPAQYRGASSDRIRILSAFDDQGRATKITTFAEGFRNAMSLALGNDAVYLATRADIYRLRDTAGRGVADERKVIVRLDTPGEYPHNGLSGFAFDGVGNIYFSLGENLGASYKLIGADGVTLHGGGEGGSIYRCRPDGSGLVRIATGFWNTFHLTLDAFGRLFAVDNDPDSRGPCRLLHIIPGGDYGYRFRNGRKGLHPFTAWNGELPGTLPMVAGTGEAPCGIVAYESTGLPGEYLGHLLSTSWGDHLVERFRLIPHGASFASHAEPFVRGDEHFRPVGIVTAPDGSLYLSDWVDKSYPVHGKGRIWRIRMKHPPADDGLRAARVAALDTPRLQQLLGHRKWEIRAAAARALARRGAEGVKVLTDSLQRGPDRRVRVQALWGIAQLNAREAAPLLELGLGDSAPEVRTEAVRLYGELPLGSSEDRNESRLQGVALRDANPLVRLQAILQVRSEPSLEALVPVLAQPDPFLAAAALESLSRPGHGKLLAGQHKAKDPKLRVGVLLALRRSGEPSGRDLIPAFLADRDPEVRRAAIQWVGEEGLREFAPLLKDAAALEPVTRELFEALLASNEFLKGTRGSRDEVSGEEYVLAVVQDGAQPASLRAIALRMLRPDHPRLRTALLQSFLLSSQEALRREALRALVMRPDDASQALLRNLAADARADRASRADAILGLAQSAPTSAETRRVLLDLLDHPDLAPDVLRSLRGTESEAAVEKALWLTASGLREMNVNPTVKKELAQQILLLLGSSEKKTDGRLRPVLELGSSRPRSLEEWRPLLTGPGNSSAGERVYFHPRGPRCFVCHRVDGRGGAIGPELSSIGRALSREKLIESILVPSKEIAPQFTSWLITTRDGKVRTGMIVDEGPNSTLTLADSQGKLEVIHRTQVEERHAVPTSIMPSNLPDLMTQQEFLDLVAFLGARK